MNEPVGFGSLTLDGFLGRLAAGDPTPGGGTASAVAGSMGAALVRMVAGLTLGNKKYSEVQKEVQAWAEEAALLQAELSDLADEDSEAFDQVMTALRMPKTSDREKKARTRALGAATRQATEVPRQVLRRCLRVLQLALELARVGNDNAVSDALVGGELAAAGVRGAAANVMINLSALKDEGYRSEAAGEVDRAEAEMMERLVDLRAAASERM